MKCKIKSLPCTYYNTGKPQLYTEDWLASGLSVSSDIQQNAGLITYARDHWDVNESLELPLEVDGEWYGDKIQPISLQIAEFAPCESRWERFYEHPQYAGQQLNPSWGGETPLEDILSAIGHRTKPSQLAIGRPLTVKLFIYFSEGDIRLFLGDALARDLFQQQKLQRKAYLSSLQPIALNYWLERNHLARQVQIDIQDLSGYRMSLLNTALELNIPMPAKDLMDDYKDRMNVAYEEQPDTFIQYAMGDLILFEVYQKRLQNQNFCRGVLGLSECNAVAKSPGRQVCDLFVDWLKERFSVSSEVLQHLSLDPSGYGQLETLLREGSIERMLETDQEFTRRNLALIQGGRARNESGGHIVHRGLVISADLSGAYSTAMRSMTYPIGLPTIVSFPKNEPAQWLTLANLQTRYGNELLDHLWMAVIDTIEPLDFDQDVVFSKINAKLTFEDLREDWLEEGVAADFVLLTREIENGILTSSTLQLLQKVATRREWAELKRKIRIKALMFYPRSAQCSSLDEWQGRVLSGGKLQTRGNAHHLGNETEDNRSRAWLGVRLSEFLDPLADKRRELKAQRNTQAQDSEAYRKLDAEQKAVKLIINTLYGVICSRFFPLNNVLVANNITALVRNSCWCMVKASNGKTAITDGSEALLNQFAFLRYPENRKAGLSVFAKANDYGGLDANVRKYYKLAPLGGGAEWQQVNQQTEENGDTRYCLSNGDIEIWGKNGSWSDLDRLYKEHMTSFWQSYGLTFLDIFSYEMKDVYQDLGLLGVANYGMRTLDGRLYTKIRGVKSKEVIEGYGLHPRQQVYESLLDGNPVETVPLYEAKQLIKVDGWGSNRNLQENYLPGDMYKQCKYPGLFTASQFTYRTKASANDGLSMRTGLSK